MVETEETNLQLRCEIQTLRLRKKNLEEDIGDLRLDKQTLEVSVANMKKMFEDEIEETQHSLTLAGNRCAVMLWCTV